MIQPNELRLGNWVEFNGKLRKIVELAPKICWIKYEAGISCITYDSIQPIPLTEEVLRKAGFEKCKDEDGNWIFSLTGIDIWNFNDEYWVCELLDQNGIETPIKYMHQLQNLIHAMTSHELEVKW